MFLDEHVNHEPQFLLYFQQKLALKSGKYHVLIISLSISVQLFFLLISVSFFYSLIPVFVQCIHSSLRTYMRFATESVK